MPRDEEPFVDALRELKIADPTGTVYGMRTVPVVDPATQAVELNPAPAGPERPYDVPSDGDCFFYCMMRHVKAWKDSGDPQRQAAYEQVSRRLGVFAAAYNLQEPGFDYADPFEEHGTNEEEQREIQRLRLLVGAHLGAHFPAFYQDSNEFAITARLMYKELIAWPHRLPQRQPFTDAEKSSKRAIEREANERLHLLRELAKMPDTAAYVRDGLTRAVQMAEKYLQYKRHTPNADKFYWCVKACMQQLAAHYEQDDGANRQDETRDTAIVQTKTPNEWTYHEVAAPVLADLLGVYIDFYEVGDNWSKGKHRDTTGPLQATVEAPRIQGGLNDAQFFLPKLTILRSPKHFRYQLSADLVLPPTDVADQERYRNGPSDAIAKYYEVGATAEVREWADPAECGPDLDELAIDDDAEDDPRPAGGGGGDGGGDGEGDDSGGGGGDDNDESTKTYQSNFVAGTMRLREFAAEDHICASGALTEEQLEYARARLQKAHDSFMVHMSTRHGYGQILLMSELGPANAAAAEGKSKSAAESTSLNKKMSKTLEDLNSQDHKAIVAAHEKWRANEAGKQIKDDVRRGLYLAMSIILHFDKLRALENNQWKALLYLYQKESNVLTGKYGEAVAPRNVTETEFKNRWSRVLQEVKGANLDSKPVSFFRSFMNALILEFDAVPSALSDEEAERIGAVKTVAELMA